MDYALRAKTRFLCFIYFSLFLDISTFRSLFVFNFPYYVGQVDLYGGQIKPWFILIKNKNKNVNFCLQLFSNLIPFLGIN